MTYAFGDSFDCYAAPVDVANGYWTAYTSGLFTLVAGRFTGSQAVQAAGSNNMMFFKSSGVNDAVHHICLAYRQTNTLTGTNTYINIEMWDGGSVQCAILFRSDGAILLKSGTAGGGGATLATYSGAVGVINTWYQFEIEVVINNTTGSFKVRRNGNTVDDSSTTGINTRGGTANNYVNQIMLGVGTANSSQVDDLFWQSGASTGTWLGDIKCVTRMPASDASVQFSRTPVGTLTQSATGTFNGTYGGNNGVGFSQFTAAYSGTVTSVGVAVSQIGNAVNLKCAIYADAGGVPGAVLASAIAPVTPVVVGTNTFTFTGVPVVKGTQYWVGSVGDGTSGTFLFVATLGNGTNGANGTMSYAAFPQANPVVSIPGRVVQMNWFYNAAPANWQAVSEALQDGTTSYVYDSTAGHTDFYNIGTIAATPASTVAVTTRGYMEKSDAGNRIAAVQIKSGGTTVASPSLVLSSSGFQWIWRTDTTDPNTGAAWTAAAVASAQIGPTVIS